MRTRKHALTLAAMAALSMSTFCIAGDPAPMTPGTPPQPTAETKDRNMGDMPMPQKGTMTDMNKMDMGGADMKDGMQNDMTVNHDLMMIAKDPSTAPDKLFVLGALCGNMWEIEFSKTVESMSQDKQVKDLAMMIEKDHTEAQQKLLPIASSLGITPPAGLTSEKANKLNVFKALPPDKLGMQYLAHMKVDHAKDITDFAGESKMAMNPEVKGYASETLPHLKEHGMKIVEVANAKGMPGGLVMPDDQAATPMPMK